jgi:hypothetical protein
MYVIELPWRLNITFTQFKKLTNETYATEITYPYCAPACHGRHNATRVLLPRGSFWKFHHNVQYHSLLLRHSSHALSIKYSIDTHLSINRNLTHFEFLHTATVTTSLSLTTPECKREFYHTNSSQCLTAEAKFHDCFGTLVDQIQSYLLLLDAAVMSIHYITRSTCQLWQEL